MSVFTAAATLSEPTLMHLVGVDVDEGFSSAVEVVVVEVAVDDVAVDDVAVDDVVSMMSESSRKSGGGGSAARSISSTDVGPSDSDATVTFSALIKEDFIETIAQNPQRSLKNLPEPLKNSGRVAH